MPVRAAQGKSALSRFACRIPDESQRTSLALSFTPRMAKERQEVSAIRPKGLLAHGKGRNQARMQEAKGVFASRTRMFTMRRDVFLSSVTDVCKECKHPFMD